MFSLQVYILGYIAKAVLYKVPDRGSSENGGIEEQGDTSTEIRFEFCAVFNNYTTSLSLL